MKPEKESESSEEESESEEEAPSKTPSQVRPRRGLPVISDAGRTAV
jgi:hypothetical protein